MTAGRRRATGAAVARSQASQDVPDQEIAPGGAEGPPRGHQMLVYNGFPTVSQVRMLGPNGGTWNPYVVNRTRKRIHATVKMLAVLAELRPMRPPVGVTLRYVFAEDRQRDEDNFALVAKPVIDGLVRAGILSGDDHARLHERVEFVVEKGARKLIVILEEVSEEARPDKKVW